MANAALIARDDGSFEATPELRELLHVKPGARLELVQHGAQEIRFRVTEAETQDWRGLAGMLSGSEVDLNEERRKERERELEREERQRE